MGNTPSMLASATGVTDVVKLLVGSRADVTARNEHQNGGAPNGATVFWRNTIMLGQIECANDETH